MSNMAHCRFHNTKIDIQDCLDAVHNQDIPSNSELNSAKSMFENVLTFLQDNGVIDEFNEDALNEMLDEALNIE